jgi:hypothetical protein
VAAGKTMVHNSDLVLLSSIYPFFCRDLVQEYQSARLQIKTASLLYDRVAIAASVLMKSEWLCRLVQECGPMVSRGVLQLDVRDGFDSLAAFQKHNQFSEHSGLLPYIESIDRLSPTIIRYQAAPTAGQYVNMLRAYISEYRARARTSHVIGILDRALERLDAAGDTFTVEDAASLCDGCYLAQRCAFVARVLYCIVGGLAIEAPSMLPENAWQGIDERAPVLGLSNLEPSLVERADRLVLEWFSLDSATIDRLTPEEVLDLKDRGSTEQYVSQLRQVVSEIESSIRQGTLSSATSLEAQKLQDALRARIHERCRRDQKKHKVESLMMGGLDEGAGLAIPGVSVLRKAGIRVGRAIARRTGARVLEKTSTPITTYVGDLTHVARGRVRASGTIL